MPVIEQFLGERVEIPDDRRYWPKQGLWAKQADDGVEFGFSQAALLLLGGIKDLDWLVVDGDRVQAGDSIIFAITSKILYIDAPFAGIVSFNSTIKDSPESLNGDPYERGWLFLIQPEKETEQVYRNLVSAEEYIESLKKTEGFKNPEGLKGGVSGICKAVYSGIGEQKI
jgi:glycine cleavage system H protein